MAALSPKQINRLNIPLARASRLVTKNHIEGTPTKSDCEELRVAGILSSEIAIMRARLLYIARICATAPLQFKAVLAWEQEWRNMIINDLYQFWRQAKDFKMFPDPRRDSTVWEHFMVASKKAWKRAVGKFVGQDF